MKNVVISIKEAQAGQSPEVVNVIVEVNGRMTDRYITKSPYKLISILTDEDFKEDQVTVVGLN